MNKLKFLLTILMAALIAFAAQRAYYVRMQMIGSIYSDIIFTRLAVESQEYTRQIEYGVKNGKSLENFYNIESVLAGVRRCFSYTNGAYIFSEDHRLLYQLSDSEDTVTRFSVADFSDGRVYSVYDDTTGGRYILTLPIFGRDNDVCGYMVLDISRSAVDNKLEDYRSEYMIQSAVTGVICWLAGTVLMIHMVPLQKETDAPGNDRNIRGGMRPGGSGRGAEHIQVQRYPGGTDTAVGVQDHDVAPERP